MKVLFTFIIMTLTMIASTSIYDVSIQSIDGQPLDLEVYKGKPILFVNVASECGYTKQYAQLQELHLTHGEEITIIGVPCNDFGGQEPGSAEEIVSFCQKNFGVTFPLTEKVSIKGDTHPLYTWLTSKSSNGVDDYTVKWNFHKFVISAEGELVGSYASGVDPMGAEILSHIK